MKITGIVETCLYTNDLDNAEQFYSKLPGLHLTSKEEGRHLFYRCGNQMLLIFNPEHTSTEQTNVDGNLIPLHGASGAGHIAFSIPHQDIEKWKSFLKEINVEIESEVTWPKGFISLYFRDPAGNSLEVVSSNLWNK